MISNVKGKMEISLYSRRASRQSVVALAIFPSIFNLFYLALDRYSKKIRSDIHLPSQDLSGRLAFSRSLCALYGRLSLGQPASLETPRMERNADDAMRCVRSVLTNARPDGKIEN